MTESPSHYGEAHRTLLAHVRACRVIARTQLSEDLREILSSVRKSSETAPGEEHPLSAANVDTFVSAINARISAHGMKIAQTRSQVTNEAHYVFVNTVSDEAFKTNTSLTAIELDAVKKLIDEMFESGLSFSLGLVPATQVVAGALNRSMRDSGAFIEDLVDQGWLTITIHDRVVLAIRALCELERYLIDRYGSAEQEGSVYSCFQCKDIVTIGQKCRLCCTAFHYKCGQVWLAANKMGSCPRGGCGFDWNEPAETIGVEPESVVEQESVETQPERTGAVQQQFVQAENVEYETVQQETVNG